MHRMEREDVDFEVQAALAWHDDDVKATIATLLEDIRQLRHQLARKAHSTKMASR